MGLLKLILCLWWFISFMAYGESTFSPFREGASNYVSEKNVSAASKYFKDAQRPLLSHVETILKRTEEEILSSNYETLIKEMEDFLDKEVPRARKETQKRVALVHSLNLIRGENLIDDTLHRLLTDFIERKYPTESEIELGRKFLGPYLSLKDYVTKKVALRKAFEKSAKVKEETVSSEKANPFPLKEYSFDVGKYRKLSARERIFYLYSVTQIKGMASIIDLALNVSDAKSVVTTITFRDETKEPLVLEHSPTEQYRLAIRLMKVEKKEAENDRFRLGVSVKDLDLIISAYELGVLSYDELSLVVHDKNFYVPQVKMVVKVAKYLGSLGLLAVRVHPVTAPYAIVPLILYNGYMEFRQSSERIDEDSFIFTLPESK